MNKAIFIDKDGTLIHDIPYNVDVSRITFTGGAIEALQQWKRLGYLLVIISNQSGIARDYFTEEDMEKVKDFIVARLAQHQIILNGFYYCPHYPEGINKKYAIACDCRKPLPGLILKAAEDLNIDIKSSWMIGDSLHDVEAGNRAGCRTIYIHDANEIERLFGKLQTPNYTTRNLKAAADFIAQAKLNHQEQK